MLQQGAIDSHGTEEVRGDGVAPSPSKVFGTHDSGTVENDVKFGESLGDVGGKDLIAAGHRYRGRQFQGQDWLWRPRLGPRLAASSNDYLIAEFMKSFSECAANPGASACNRGWCCHWFSWDQYLLAI